jgi:hypothetical protein
MATTTPNYGWPVPTSTDYVKDGATAIEALGDAIDATVFGIGSSGLTLVKTQTIGTAVSSVTVTNAFSATYDAYRVIVDGGVASGVLNISLKLGASTTGYYSGGTEGTYAGAISALANNNAAAWNTMGTATTGYISCDFQLVGVAAARFTRFQAMMNSTSSSVQIAGIHQVATAYTDFTLTPGGTLTGGTIRVYGYKN